MRIKLTHVTPLLAAGAAAVAILAAPTAAAAPTPLQHDLHRDRRGHHVPVAGQC